MPLHAHRFSAFLRAHERVMRADRRLRCAAQIVAGHPAEQVAERFHISRSTALRWTTEALHSVEPDRSRLDELIQRFRSQP